MKSDPRLYYISDPAYSVLIGMAQRHKYVEFGSERVKGLSAFLNDLALFPMKDTRPPLIVERHIQELRNNRAPTWLHVRMRRARQLSLTEDALARYLIVALQVGIIQETPYARGGPDRRTPYPTVSLVLEGIGLRWITPVEFPNYVE